MPGVVEQPAAGSGGVGSVRGWLCPSWQAERSRVERLELLDELEEWKLLQVRLGCCQQCHFSFAVLPLHIQGDCGGCYGHWSH